MNQSQTRHRSKFISFTLLLASIVVGVAEESIELGKRRELFVDHYLTQVADDVDLVLKEPVDRGPVLLFDAPWEGRFSAYVTVLKDEDRVRLYYRGIPDAGNDGNPAEVTCYAESPDGLEWTKPNLGLYEIHGTRANNVILANAAPVTHNFCPFIDRNPQANENARYKAIGGISSSGVIAYQSPDGIRWEKIQEQPVFKPEGWVLDSQNVAFWSERERCYVLHYRSSVDGVRAIAKTTSQDFLHWTEPVQMGYSDTHTTKPSHHLYTNQTHPYFRAPHIYFATAARFLPNRQVLTDAQAKAINVHPKYFRDTSDSVFMTTRGSHEYDRTFLGALIKPGIGAVNWVSRSNYPALNLIPTGPTEMSLYVNQNYGQPSAHLRRYSFRLDGISCLRAPYAGGEWMSKTFTFSGSRLYLNFATSAAGSIQVELQDPRGRPIPGFSYADGQELIGNDIDRPMQWQGDLGTLADRSVRLRLKMKDAELYSFQFR
jgi:hypothetical protein